MADQCSPKESHDANVGLLVVIDGDQYGVIQRRRDLAKRLKDANQDAIRPSDPVAIVVPTWHIEATHVPALTDARNEVSLLGV